MPSAIVDTRQTVKRELATLPGGEVTLRKLSYGEVLERSEMASSMRAAAANREQRRNNESPDGAVTVTVHYLAIQRFDFNRCIVDHNLEDNNGKKLDLSSTKDLERLDPKVGQEIAEHIDSLNNPEAEAPQSKSPVGAGNKEGADIPTESKS
jgi:hypothetical protein